MIFPAVEEGALEVDEVRGEKDIVAEGGQEGVKFGGRGGVEGREGTYHIAVNATACK